MRTRLPGHDLAYRGPNVTLQGGATVTYRAANVILLNGFAAQPNAALTLENP